MSRIVVAALVAAMLGACASAPSLPPKAGPEEVDFYNPNAALYPPEGYRTIAPVTVEVAPGTSNEVIYLELRRAAARLGADAVVLQSIRSSTEGQVAPDRDERIIARGLAIYWPAEDSAGG